MRFHAYLQTQPHLEDAPLGLGPLQTQPHLEYAPLGLGPQTYLGPVRKRQPLYLGHLRDDVVNPNHHRPNRKQNANHQRLPHRSLVVRL